MIDGLNTIGLIVLAAGQSSRFGIEDKLAATLNGKPLAHHVLNATVALEWGKKVLVCRDAAEWSEPYRNAGYSIVENRNTEGGMLFSLHAGLTETRDLPYTLICLADMPFVDSIILERLARAALTDNLDVVACHSENYKGPPAIFRTSLLAALPSRGEGGARSLLASATFIHCPQDKVRDVDTLQDLEIAALNHAATD